MENEKEVFEAEIDNEEKETVDAEVVDEEVETLDDRAFDPNVVLQTIMGAQDQGLKNVVLKLSTLNMVTKVTAVCMLFKFTNILGVFTLLYGFYCAIYVLINYDKVKENEYMIQDVLNKGKQVSIKKTVKNNLLILALCIPLALVSFWYYFVFQVS